MNGIEIYADTSDITAIKNIYKNFNFIKGITTNPTLMRKANISDYVSFVKEMTTEIKDLPISFEIFADDLEEMEKQIERLASFADNIFVKVPITNTKRESTVDLIEKMSKNGVKINVTAIFTQSQLDLLYKKLLKPETPIIFSIFAGRIADTGINPVPFIQKNAQFLKNNDSSVKLLWASTRTVYNIYEAIQSECDIITVTPDILDKIKLKDKNLDDFSLETVKMFYNDAELARYKL